MGDLKRANKKSKPPQDKGPLEHDIQKAFFNVCRFHAEIHNDWRWGNVFATPNQAARSFAVAQRMRAEGMRAGVPDVFVAVPCGGYAGLWIEFKRLKAKQTVPQLQWFRDLRRAGYLCEVCFTAREGTELVFNYFSGKIRRFSNEKVNDCSSDDPGPSAA